MASSSILFNTTLEGLSQEDAIKHVVENFNCTTAEVERALHIAEELKTSDPDEYRFFEWYDVYKNEWLDDGALDMTPKEIRTILRLFDFMNMEPEITQRLHICLVQNALNPAKRNLTWKKDVFVSPEMKIIRKQWRHQFTQMKRTKAQTEFHLKPKQIFDNHIPISAEVGYDLARYGIVQRLREFYNTAQRLRGVYDITSKLNEETMWTAAENGRLECLRFLRTECDPPCGWSEESTVLAAANGHLDCLRFLHENGCPIDYEAEINAAGHGHLDCLRYLHENVSPMTDAVIDSAAENGHLECLKFAHANGCEWNIETPIFAAENGHLKCLKYIHENGCEWDWNTPLRAARRGQLECLRYAHENGCEWNKWTLVAAACEKKYNCFLYAFLNGCEWDLSTLTNIVIEEGNKFNEYLQRAKDAQAAIVGFRRYSDMK